MTNENFYLLSTLVCLVTLIFGFSSLNYKLSQKIKNDERMIERLDLIIKKLNKDEDENNDK
ncbi:hypothetical protein [Cohnella rhizosphaerae]|uniref:DUF4083 domain-containing protein n=1 Tax=Cohnella rhizosphaerae TaxID=1457232 RepID=A0A9X4KSS8_9BACL|nr:hypothetical protein [Cohnella rhizosphaerae]MDG0808074.1 hypothetical protein [Cohnella rhizosphaerae]